jgi:hypothetical protein
MEQLPSFHRQTYRAYELGNPSTLGPRLIRFFAFDGAPSVNPM